MNDTSTPFTAGHGIQVGCVAWKNPISGKALVSSSVLKLRLHIYRDYVEKPTTKTEYIRGKGSFHYTITSWDVNRTHGSVGKVTRRGRTNNPTEYGDMIQPRCTTKKKHISPRPNSAKPNKEGPPDRLRHFISRTVSAHLVESTPRESVSFVSPRH